MASVDAGPRRPAGDWTREWDTVRARENEQFDAWRELVVTAFGPLTLQREQRGAFPAFVGHRTAGPLGLFHICAPAQHVRHPGVPGPSPSRDVVFLNLMVRGAGTVEQDGRTAEQRPGQMFLLDGSRPFHKHFTADFEQLCFTLPRGLLIPRLADPATVTARRVSGDHGVGTIVAAMLRALAVDMAGLDTRTAGTVGSSLVDLLALAFGTPVAGTRVRREQLRQAALDVVERDLGHPDLCPTHVARQINVSVRSLHQLFADHGVSFGRWVLRQRLERCRRDLEDPAWDAVSITALATRWGFADPSHFGRAFRVRYGVTPSEYRRARAH